MALLIKNATIVNADKIVKETRDILLERGKIVKIAPSISPDSHKVVDAKGKYTLPGFIDLHCHLRQPGGEHKETIETGCRAAAKGGFTTILCMPNTKPVIDSRMIVEGILQEAHRVGLINVLPIGAITKGQRGEDLSDLFELKEAGCVAISDDGRSVASALMMRHAIEYAKMVGLLIMEHCEDPSLVAKGVMNESLTSTILGLKGIPSVTETIIVARDMELARYLNTRIHFCHMSLQDSVALIRFAKERGIAVSAEVCPHHFSLTEEAVTDFNTYAKVNPPLRSREDVEALKQALADDTIDCIATDHAPHAKEEKELDFDQAPFGMIGFETALGLVVRELIEPKVLSWPKVVEKMSASPARIIGLETKGTIAEGMDADITIVDPKKEWIFTEENIVSKSKNSPFIGQTMKGRVEVTICNGKVVYEAQP